MDKHNRHHAHPNTEGADPDIAVGALAFTTAQARTSRGVARLVFRHQACPFFPLLLLGEAVSLHVASAQALTRRACRNRPAEVALLAAHATGCLTVVLLVLSPVKAVVFILVQQGLFGLYLGCFFAPDHKGMPTLYAAGKPHRYAILARTPDRVLAAGRDQRRLSNCEPLEQPASSPWLAGTCGCLPGGRSACCPGAFGVCSQPGLSPLVVPACTRDCDSSCSGPRWHLGTPGQPGGAL